MDFIRCCAVVLSAAGRQRGQTDDIESAATELAGDQVPAVARALVEPWLADGGRLMFHDDRQWPAGLRSLGPAEPLALWVRGSMPEESFVSIVGSRRCTGYGRTVTDELATVIVGDGRTVVSGGAIGIDGIAHRAALQARGRTVVFLAGGAGTVYPREHAAMLQQAQVDGAVAWEFPPTAPLRRESFLVRNRLIAAVSEATVVVEAADRSGALNTGRSAADLGRLVLAVPGPVNSPASSGTNRAIADGWAAILLGAADLRGLLDRSR